VESDIGYRRLLLVLLVLYDVEMPECRRKVSSASAVPLIRISLALPSYEKD